MKDRQRDRLADERQTETRQTDRPANERYDNSLHVDMFMEVSTSLQEDPQSLQVELVWKYLQERERLVLLSSCILPPALFCFIK